MRLGIALRGDICARRGWHRCREVENPQEGQEAVCVECAAFGDLRWAAENLIREHANENAKGTPCLS